MKSPERNREGKPFANEQSLVIKPVRDFTDTLRLGSIFT